MKQRKVKNTIKLTALNLVFIIICAVCLVPILYALSLSFSGSSGALSSDFHLIPQDFTLKNYQAVFTEKPFLTWFKNSVILSAGTMVFAMGFAVTAAYAVSRYRFKGRRGLMMTLLMLNAFPDIVYVCYFPTVQDHESLEFKNRTDSGVCRFHVYFCHLEYEGIF